MLTFITQTSNLFDLDNWTKLHSVFLPRDLTPRASTIGYNTYRYLALGNFKSAVPSVNSSALSVYGPLYILP